MNIVKTPVAWSKFKEVRKTLFKVIAIEKRELSLSSNLLKKKRAGEFLRARVRGNLRPPRFLPKGKGNCLITPSQKVVLQVGKRYPSEAGLPCPTKTGRWWHLSS